MIRHLSQVTQELAGSPDRSVGKEGAKMMDAIGRGGLEAGLWEDTHTHNNTFKALHKIIPSVSRGSR